MGESLLGKASCVASEAAGGRGDGGGGEVAKGDFGSDVLVERWFWRVWSRCPLIMAIERGGYWRRSWGVSPGNWGRKPFWRAWAKVERAGENKAAWANATSSAGVAEPMAPRAEGGGEGIEGEFAEARSICQSLLCGVRCPRRIGRLLYDMVTVEAVKATVQPASQNWPMERREKGVRWGTM